MQLALRDFLRRNIYSRRKILRKYIYNVKNMKENIYNLSNGKEKKKKFNIELGQSKTFPYPNIYFHLSE